MIYKNRPRSSSLFLIELILAILFFSIASAICVRFFVNSHILSEQSRTLTQSVNECSSLAEICRTSASLEEALTLIEQEYPLADSRKNHTNSAVLHFYFDKDFTACKKAVRNFELELTLTELDFMLSAEMNVTDCSDDVSIYELETLHHLPRRVAHE